MTYAKLLQPLKKTFDTNLHHSDKPKTKETSQDITSLIDYDKKQTKKEA